MENVLDILGGVKDYAHRGCFDKTLPENSLTAIRIAADKGLGLEIDVHLTKDNKLVVFHDHTLKRMCGVSGIVEEMTESQLTALKLKNTLHTIPTLKFVLAVFQGVVRALDGDNSFDDGSPEKHADVIQRVLLDKRILSFAAFPVDVRQIT